MVGAPKTRTIHIYQPARMKPDDTEVTLAPEFWNNLHLKVAALDKAKQFVTMRGTEYRGAARHSTASAVDYMYLGRSRDKADFPETSIGDDDEQPLILDEDGRLVEPCYLYPVNSQNNTVALLRSSGGPMVSAVEEWLTKLLKDKLGNDSIKLKPVVRHDQLERLNNARNVAKFAIKLEKDQDLGPADGRIVGSVGNAYSSLGTGATMSIEWSYGNSAPKPSVGQSQLGQIKQFLDWGATKSAEATVIREDEDGKFIRDKIDFIKDRVTFRIPIGDSADVVQSPAVVTEALKLAAKKFNELNLIT